MALWENIQKSCIFANEGVKMHGRTVCGMKAKVFEGETKPGEKLFFGAKNICICMVKLCKITVEKKTRILYDKENISDILDYVIVCL